jgi:hypothetical protein
MTRTSTVNNAEAPQVGGSHLSPAETLAGLPGVLVYVHLSDELKQAGLDEATLRTDVASQLRRGGVRVLTEDEMARTPGMPSIEVNVNGQPHPDGPWILYNVRVTVAERARLLRPPHGLVDAWVWNVSTVGCTGPGGVSDIREAVAEKVKVFITAYRTANPKF